MNDEIPMPAGLLGSLALALVLVLSVAVAVCWVIHLIGVGA